MNYRLEDWSVVFRLDTHIQLVGNVYDHYKYEDGEKITTSIVTEVEGRDVKTMNSSYLLGDPSPDYIKMCELCGRHIPTKNEPIKLLIETKEIE